MNLSLGGSSGNSGGKDNRALKKPPSLYNAEDLSTIVSIRSNKCNVLQGIRGSEEKVSGRHTVSTISYAPNNHDLPFIEVILVDQACASCKISFIVRPAGH